MVSDLPSALLSATLFAYWSGVIVKSLVNRWRHGRSAGIWPKDRIERLVWPFWTPVIGLWIVLPWLALFCGQRWLGLANPTLGESGLFAPRLVAALLGFICFVATVACWQHMGKSWSMAVVPKERTELVQTGLYAVVRHPIYALSIALMLCSLVVIPWWPMLAVAAIHCCFMAIKARNEERFLLGVHGESYAGYCRRTGRFFPRLRATNGPSSLWK